MSSIDGSREDVILPPGTPEEKETADTEYRTANKDGGAGNVEKETSGVEGECGSRAVAIDDWPGLEEIDQILTETIKVSGIKYRYRKALNFYLDVSVPILHA